MSAMKHMIGRVATPTVILPAIFVILLFSLQLSAQESWPGNSQWREMLDQNWNRMTDPAGDLNPNAVDVINDAVPTCSYFYATSTSLFFRMALAGNPIDNKNQLNPYAWMAAIDVNGDGVLDWDIRAGGITEVLYVFCFLPPQSINNPTQNWSVANPVSAGYVRSINMGTFYYLDMQVPFTALQRTGFNYNVTPTTEIRMFYHTSTSEAVDIKDATVPTADFTAAFGFVTPTTPSGDPESYGRIYDSRDSSPYSSGGTWTVNETVSVSGNGWPPSTSSYYNGGVRSVRFKNPDGTVVWSGTITTNAQGAFTNAATWQIPASATGGVYTIEVEDPRSSGTWNYYDQFTVFIPVGIKLFSFTARYDRGDVVLNWVTEEEIAVAGFIIERAQSEGAWQALASFAEYRGLEAQGTPGTHRYEFVDRNVQMGSAYRYRLVTVNLDGALTRHEPVSVMAMALPKTEVLESLYPNPFNPTTTIQFTLDQETEVDLAVFNLKGERVKTLASGRFAPGQHRIIWDGVDEKGAQQPTGSYLIRLITPDHRETRKVVLVR